MNYTKGAGKEVVVQIGESFRIVIWGKGKYGKECTEWGFTR